jgi:alginate O-acetyltransferase complex protein AlgJ
MGRLERWLIIVVAVALLLAPAVARSVGVQGRPNENRTPVALPHLGARWHFIADLGSYLDDRMPLRSVAIRGDGWADEHLFGEPRAFGGTALPNTLHGRNGVRFFHDDIALACRPAIDPQGAAEGLTAAMGAIAASGRDVVTMVAPNKTTIEGDLLPSDTIGLGCYRTFSQGLWQQLDAASIPGWVDVRHLLTTTPPADEERYKRTDTHWNGVGSILAVRAAVEHFQPGLWDDGALVRHNLTYTGDLTVLDGSPFSDTTTTVDVRRPGIIRNTTPDISTAATPTLRRITNSGPPGSLVPGRTLLLTDSFGNAAVSQMAPWFADLTIVSLNDFNADVFVSLIQHADRVWFLSVERLLPVRVAANWASPSFLTALNSMAG